MKTFAFPFALGLLCLAQAALPPQGAEAASLEWEAAFPTASAPEHVYFRANYVDGRGHASRLQVWRDGNRRLRRQTDDAIDLYAERNETGGLDLQIADHKRQVLIHADPASFHRVGRFTGWTGLAHMLEAPRGVYTLTRLEQAPPSPPIGECVWFRLEATVPAKSVNDICWSRQWGIPLAIVAINSQGARVTQFSVDDVRAFIPDPAIFAVHAEKFVGIDARPDGDLMD
jgi:hypothetical protein